jgi:hypothetical protein
LGRSLGDDKPEQKMAEQWGQNNGWLGSQLVIFLPQIFLPSFFFAVFVLPIESKHPRQRIVFDHSRSFAAPVQLAGAIAGFWLRWASISAHAPAATGAVRNSIALTPPRGSYS